MLSIAINVKNGAKYLELCLNALYRFSDVVLLDNYSTDNTLEIAKRYTNVRVFQTEFTGMGKVRNQASEFCQNDWVFFVDCDEVVSQELVNSLLHLDFKNGTVYSIFRQNYYAGKLVDSSAWENDWVRRIYNRKETKYIEYNVHESIDVSQSNVVKIEPGYIFHFPYTQIAELLDKTQFYSTLYAKQNLGKKHTKLGMIPLRALVMFIKCYLLKGGFKDGYEGFVVSTFNAIGVLVKYFKLYELEHQKAITLFLDLTTVESIEIDSIIDAVNVQKTLPDKVIIISESDLSSYTKNLVVKSQSAIPAQIRLGGTGIHTVSLTQNVDSRLRWDDSFMSGDGLPTERTVYVKDYKCLKDKRFLSTCKKKFRKYPQTTILKFVN